MAKDSSLNSMSAIEVILASLQDKHIIDLPACQRDEILLTDLDLGLFTTDIPIFNILVKRGRSHSLWRPASCRRRSRRIRRRDQAGIRRSRGSWASERHLGFPAQAIGASRCGIGMEDASGCRLVGTCSRRTDFTRGMAIALFRTTASASIFRLRSAMRKWLFD